MKLKTISVHYERKINMGDFNSATVGVSLWADLDENEDEAAAMSGLWEMAKNNVKAQALPLKGKIEAKVEEIYLGLPVQLQTAMIEGSNGHGN